MVKYVRDLTGRFLQRPHYEPDELDRECENIVNSFMRERYGAIKFPISTDDITRLLERDCDDLDLYADLSVFGSNVEGITEFRPGNRPVVKISKSLSEDERFKNRLRTTLTHEYGHVRFHSYLWDMESIHPGQPVRHPNANKQICRRDTIVDTAQKDWMEWQAGYVCGALLMPKSSVCRLVKRYQNGNGTSGIIEPSSACGAELIASTQEEYQVSAEAARVRLIKLGVFGEEVSTKIKISI